MINRLITLSILVFSGATTMAQTAKGVVRKGGTIVSATQAAPPNYSMSQLTGKWQETKRISAFANTKITFTDTLQFNFNKRDSVMVHDGTSMSLKGYAAVEGSNKLEVAGDVYTIVTLSKNALVINDGEFIRVMQKRKKFYHETLGTIILPKENLSDPVTINVKKALGKWDVYRTQATPGVAEDSAVIKHLNFTQLNEDGSVSGEVTFIKANNTQTLPFRATFEKGGLQISSLSHTWDIYTYKADGKEMVFGRQGGLVYFAKQL